MIRVLHFITSLDRGGIENWLMSMLRSIDGNSCRMDFICKGVKAGEMAYEARELGANIYHIPMGINPLGFIMKAKGIIEQGDYDIAHGHLEAYSALPLLAARGTGIPVITSFHNIEFGPQTPLARNPLIKPARNLIARFSVNYAISRSDLITGCSKSVLESLRHGQCACPERARVIYYGIEIEPKDARKEMEARREMGIPSESPVLMHIGRFIEQKNHEALLKLFRMVRKEMPEALLVLIGDGPLRGRIEEASRRSGLSESILFLGLRKDARSLLYGSDVFVFPSLYEGFGLAALEANAAGLPVVGSKTSGIIEAVEDGKTGMLFDAHDLEGMASACLLLLNDAELRKKMGRGGIERAKRLFSVERSASDLLTLYGDSLKSRLGHIPT